MKDILVTNYKSVDEIYDKVAASFNRQYTDEEYFAEFDRILDEETEAIYSVEDLVVYAKNRNLYNPNINYNEIFKVLQITKQPDNFHAILYTPQEMKTILTTNNINENSNENSIVERSTGIQHGLADLEVINVFDQENNKVELTFIVPNIYVQKVKSLIDTAMFEWLEDLDLQADYGFWEYIKVRVEAFNIPEAKVNQVNIY